MASSTKLILSVSEIDPKPPIRNEPKFLMVAVTSTSPALCLVSKIYKRDEIKSFTLYKL